MNIQGQILVVLLALALSGFSSTPVLATDLSQELAAQGVVNIDNPRYKDVPFLAVTGHENCDGKQEAKASERAKLICDFFFRGSRPAVYILENAPGYESPLMYFDSKGNLQNQTFKSYKQFFCGDSNESYYEPLSFKNLGCMKVPAAK